MHSYRRFVQEQMDARGMKQADLARASGVSDAVLSRILTDDRDRIARPPSEATVNGLAKAFRIDSSVIWLRVAQAMGLPVGEQVVVADGGLLSDEDLIRALSERLAELRKGGGDPNNLVDVGQYLRRRVQAERGAPRRTEPQQQVVGGVVSDQPNTTDKIRPSTRNQSTTAVQRVTGRRIADLDRLEADVEAVRNGPLRELDLDVATVARLVALTRAYENADREGRLAEGHILHEMVLDAVGGLTGPWVGISRVLHRTYSPSAQSSSDLHEATAADSDATPTDAEIREREEAEAERGAVEEDLRRQDNDDSA